MRTITIRPAVCATALALFVSGLMPAVAAAHTRKSGNSPPGNSAINQYVESFPTAGGGKPTGGIKHNHGRPGGPSGSGAVSPSTQQAMTNSGGAGQGAAAFANATAPSSSGGAQTGGGAANAGSGHAGSGRSGSTPGSTGSRARGLNAPSSATVSSSATGGNSPIKGVLSAFFGSSSSGGLGAWLPALLIVILVGGCVIGLRHRFRRGSS